MLLLAKDLLLVQDLIFKMSFWEDFNYYRISPFVPVLTSRSCFQEGQKRFVEESRISREGSVDIHWSEFP